MHLDFMTLSSLYIITTAPEMGGADSVVFLHNKPKVRAGCVGRGSETAAQSLMSIML